MSKGEATRQTILDHAVKLASQVGLEGVSIGRLAEELGLSKSGVFAHFESKEALQAQVLSHAAQLFVDRVVRPALKAPRGEARVRELFERWLEWERAAARHGGCIFVAAATELDDREGPARDELVRQQRDWLELIAGVARTAIGEGHFRADLDPGQFAYELHGLILACHHGERLLRDPRTEERARRAFESLLSAARAGASTRPTSTTTAAA
ncbi:MAG TPA: TetR/AcrR family transcriptional regulator [Thermoanaerobaculia bacterium]|nr:TetR/AcrR family transcriptional regulator [Thermoanaerobaculia bacterium]